MMACIREEMADEIFDRVETLSYGCSPDRPKSIAVGGDTNRVSRVAYVVCGIIKLAEDSNTCCEIYSGAWKSK
jgi:hypothetical protein